jgi:undecaprenyl-diphosphatase
MPIYQVVVLAIIQGLTEFLPVSSTAHLALAHWLFGWDFHAATKEMAQQYDFSFDVALHVGTLLAVIVYFFRDWLQIIAQAFGIRFGRDRQLAHNRGMLWLLIFGTIPVGLAGLAFGKHAEGDWRSPWVIATMLIVVGMLMWIGDGLGARNKDLSSMRPGDAGAIGLAQAFAIIPGVSRSGITITAGLFRNLDREAAARYSFLLSTPAIAAAAAKAYWDLHKHYGGIPHDMRVPCIVGALVSAFVGVIVIAFLLDYLRHNSLRVFAWYRIGLGVLVIVLTMAGVAKGL